MRKILLAILPYIIIAVLGSFLYISVKRIFNLNREIELQSANILEAERENSNLVFANGQLKDYLEAQNTRETRLIDSLARDYNIRLKRIKEAQVTHVHYIDTNIVDSIHIVYKVIEKIDSTRFKKPFEVNKDCYHIAGAIETADLTSLVAFDSVEFNDDIVYIKYTKRAKWYEFWKWFKPKRPESITIGKCSNVTFKHFEEEN